MQYIRNVGGTNGFLPTNRNMTTDLHIQQTVSIDDAHFVPVVIFQHGDSR